MTCLWVKATKQIYLETPFSEKQFVILDTSSSERFCTFVNSHSFNFKHAYRINNASFNIKMYAFFYSLKMCLSNWVT